MAGGRVFVELARTTITASFDARHGRLLISLSLFSFFAMNFFAGCFVGSLVAPSREAEVDTLAELERRVDVVYATPVAGETLSRITQQDDPVVFALGAKKRAVKSAREVVSELSTSTRAVVITAETGVKLYQHFREASKDGVLMLRRVKECILAPAFYSFPVRPGWPQRERFSELVQRLVQGGVGDLVRDRDLFSKVKMFNGTYHIAHNYSPLTYQPLSTLHLRPIFICLGVGLLLASVVFVMELWWIR